MLPFCESTVVIPAIFLPFKVFDHKYVVFSDI